MPTIFVSSKDKYNLDIAKSHINNLLICEAVICTVIALLVFILFKDKPKTVANRASKRQKEKNFVISLKTVAKNKNIYVLSMIYGFTISAVNTSATIVGEVVEFFGFTST